MKVLHTADWHLGHQLHGYSRHREHQYFLDWLLDYIEREGIDVLMVCGDIFDTANPSATSWQQLYQFLGKLATQSAGVQVIMVAGNHDSPSKINAPGELLNHFNLHFIGSVPRNAQGEVELNRLLIPLKRRSGELQGWALALPFLRSGDIHLDANISDTQHRWQQGVHDLYRQLADLAASLRREGQCLISLGHAHVRGGQLSELSERHIQVGGQHALPLSIFPSESDYVALGHLHLAQQVKANDNLLVHYSGSPLALSMSERRYQHQVKVLRFNEGGLQVDSVSVPKLCKMHVVGERGSSLEEVIKKLQALDSNELEFDARPFLEVRVQLDKPQAQVREKILAAIENKGLRLAKISITYANAQDLSFSQSGQQLAQLKPEEVFELCHQQQFASPPSDALREAFHQVLQTVFEDDE